MKIYDNIFFKNKKRKEGFYFLALLVYAYVPNAVATNTAATMATIADENSAILVGVGVGDIDGSVTELVVGIQMASMAAPLEVGVYVSELEVYTLFEEHCTTQHRNLKSVPAVCVMVVEWPIVAEKVAPDVDPAGLVVPPAVAKMVNVDVPLPDVVAVVLLVGTKTASKEQVAVRVLVYGLSVDAIGPVAAAYTKHTNWKPDEAVAWNFSVSPLVKVVVVPEVMAVPFAVTDFVPNVV